jgi:hypothetical protein
MKWMHIIGATLALVSFPAWSQGSDEWDWKVTPYLWGINMTGDLAIGPISQDIDVSFSDILSNMEIGGAIFTEFGKGKHAVHIDYTYLRLRPEPTDLSSPPFPPGSTLSSKLTVNILEPAYNYRWNGPGGPALVFGARLTDLKIRLSPARLPAATSGPDWWDYFVGVKTHNAISAKWEFDFYATVGAGGSDLPWTLQTVFGRRFENNNRLDLGVRIWGVDYSTGSGIQRTAIDLTYYGFMIGYEFN